MKITDMERSIAIVGIHKVIDNINDGHHDDIIMRLIDASNDIYYEMSERNQTKMRKYFDSEQKRKEMAE